MRHHHAHHHEHHEARFRGAYGAGLIATIGLVLMIVAGINAGVNPNFYWPWDQCSLRDSTREVTVGGATPGPSDAAATQCYANGNDQGVYITTLLFTGLAMFVFFGFLAGVLYFSYGVTGRTIGGGLGLAGYETKESFAVAGDGLHLAPGRAVRDSLSMGVGAPLKTGSYALRGKRSGERRKR